MEDPLTEKTKLPETPDELNNEEFVPELPEIVGDDSSRIVKWVTELSQWDALYALFYTLASTTGGTLFGLIVSKTIVWGIHWFLPLLFVVGGFAAILVKILKKREQRQQIIDKEKESELDMRIEVHEQTLAFNEKTFNNKVEIELKRAELQQEIDRNESIDLREHMFSLIEQRPKEGAPIAEFQLYSDQLKLLGKVLETHTLDRAIRYGKYDVYESKNLLDQMENLTKTVNNILSNTALIQQNTTENKDKYYDIHQALQIMLEAKKAENIVGIIEWDIDGTIIAVNDTQIKYTGVETYQTIGKDGIKLIEEHYLTDQINILLKAVKDAYRGKITHMHIKNYCLMEGCTADICLTYVPKYDTETYEIIGLYTLTNEIDKKVISCPYIEYTLPKITNDKDDEEVILLVGTTIVEDTKYYKDLLKYYGYTILTCKSITEAIDIMNKQLIHVALIDIVFQDGSAEEIVQEMIQKYPNIQIIVIASYDNQALMAKLKLIDNVYSYKTKPVRPQDIVITVQKAVSKALTKKISLERSKNINAKEIRKSNGNTGVNLTTPE